MLSAEPNMGFDPIVLGSSLELNSRVKLFFLLMFIYL